MRCVNRAGLLLVCLLGLCVLPLRAQPPAQAQQAALYTPLVLTLPADESAYRNPFDPNDIEMLAIFNAPSGARLVVPGFWTLPYEDRCPEPCAAADFQPAGAPQWQVRFTPDQVGTWTYTLQLRQGGGLISSEDGQFEVAPSARDGFIGVGANGRYFQFDSGRPYFPVGLNLKWSWDGVGGVRTYQRWLRELSAAGVNYARLFIDVPWFISLEWQGPAGDYRAAQRAAAELDAILDTAAETGVYLQLVLLWSQSLTVYNGPPVLIPTEPARPSTAADWDDHPYNVLNGGVLSGPGAFFASPPAQDLFRRRLRYIAARWGFSPQVFAWEIVDRVDRLGNFSEQVAGEWLRSVTAYLREIDQHDHLITAGSQESTTVIYDNPLLDFTPFEFYQRRPIEAAIDQQAGVSALTQRYREVTSSPVLLTAFSLNPWYEPTADDPTGVHVGNTLWASVLAGGAGGAASDWWDTYILPAGLQRYFTPLAAFTAGIDWPNLALQPAQASLLTDDEGVYAPLRLDGFARRFAFLPRAAVLREITPDGVFPELADQTSYLYGQVYNNRFSQAQRYRVVVPVDTYLELGVRAVSDQAGARLIVTLDEQPALELELRAGSRDIVARLPLVAGEHEIVLDNSGNDWLELAYIEIGHLVAPARALTLRDADAGVALAWIQHGDYTWEQVAAHVARAPLTLRYRLNRLPPGRYVVETWDPLGGGVLGEELLRVGADGLLDVDLLPFDAQIALRILRQPEAPAATATLSAHASPSAPPSPTAPARSATATPTITPSPTATARPLTAVPSLTPTATLTPTVTRTPTITRTPTRTVTPFPSAQATIIQSVPRLTRTPGTPAAPLVVSTNTPRPTHTDQP